MDDPYIPDVDFTTMQHRAVRQGRQNLKRWRRLALAAVVVSLAMSLLAFGMIVLRDLRIKAEHAPELNAPTLEQLNHAISLSERYIDDLYRELPDGTATQSETYGLPFKVHFVKSDTWVLLGQDDATSSIQVQPDNQYDDDFEITFKSGSNHGQLVFQAKVNWDANKANYVVTATPKTVDEPTELWLDTMRLGELQPNDTAGIRQEFPKSDSSRIKTFRYTIRHAVQSAYLYWKQRGNMDRSNRLANFLTQNGYKPGEDVRAAMFGEAQNLPDDLPYNTAIYPDCQHLPPASTEAYPYRSKICIDRAPNTYLQISKHDPLFQAILALHLLEKYNDPNHSYQAVFFTEWWLQGGSPADTSKHLQAQWWRTNFGIPKCTPFSCENVASGIRTFTFGALQTVIGYEHNDEEAKKYADAAAAWAVRTQVREDGVIHTLQGDAYRPAQVGAFLAGWDAEGHFVPPTVNLLQATGFFTNPMPPEYTGFQPSNSETAFDGWTFLVRYRCARYNVCTKG